MEVERVLTLPIIGLETELPGQVHRVQSAQRDGNVRYPLPDSVGGAAERPRTILQRTFL